MVYALYRYAETINELSIQFEIKMWIFSSWSVKNAVEKIVLLISPERSTKNIKIVTSNWKIFLIFRAHVNIPDYEMIY